MSGARAVVADGSHFMRSVISDVLEDGGVEVVARACNGREAVEAVTDHEPDVVTMGVEMPEMDGIEAVERIMEACPTPVLVLSAHTGENADVTRQALDCGAVDCFTGPGGEVTKQIFHLNDRFVERVRSVAGTDVGEGAVETDAPDGGRPASRTYVEHPTLLVGSSMGGPAVVERLLSELPVEAGFRVLVVQHMPGGFTGRFAERIDAGSQYDVREASDGDRIGAGEALVAPGDKHMLVGSYRGGRLRVTLTEDPPVNRVRPAVDTTMASAAAVIDDPLVGVILTGMGEDGAAGVNSLEAVGGTTIAQDRDTSAAFGMPRQAIETGHVDEVLAIEDIVDGVVRAVRADTPDSRREHE